MPAGDLYKFVINQSIQSSNVQNVWYFEDTDGIGADPEAELNGIWLSDISGPFRACQSDTLTVVLGRVTQPQKNLMDSLALIMSTPFTAPGGSTYQFSWAVRNPMDPFEIQTFLKVDKPTALPRLATQRRRRTPIVLTA